LKVVELSAEAEVFLGEQLGDPLDCLTSLRYLIVYSLVFCVEMVKAIIEILGHVGGLTEHFTSQCLDLLNFSGTSRLLFPMDIRSELILILLSQEVLQELAST